MGIGTPTPSSILALSEDHLGVLHAKTVLVCPKTMPLLHVAAQLVPALALKTRVAWLASALVAVLAEDVVKMEGLIANHVTRAMVMLVIVVCSANAQAAHQEILVLKKVVSRAVHAMLITIWSMFQVCLLAFLVLAQEECRATNALCKVIMIVVLAMNLSSNVRTYVSLVHVPKEFPGMAVKRIVKSIVPVAMAITS